MYDFLLSLQIIKPHITINMSVKLLVVKDYVVTFSHMHLKQLTILESSIQSLLPDTLGKIKYCLKSSG